MPIPAQDIPVRHEYRVDVPVRVVEFDREFLRRDMEFIRKKYEENEGYFLPATVCDWWVY